MKRRSFIASSLVIGTRLGLPAGAVVLSACGKNPQSGTRSTFSAPTMGTTYRVTLVDSSVDDDRLATLREEMENILNGVVGEMSTYEAGSSLSRFNDATDTGWRKTPSGLATVAGEALAVSRWSDGAFDVTVGPLVDLWGFGPQGTRVSVPLPDEIEQVAAAVGYQKLHFDESASSIQKKHADVRLDLSAIAKGFAVDRLGAYLDEQGIENYLIDIGGELRAGGLNDRGKHWRIAVEQPVPGRREVQRIVGLSDAAIATSGDYRNFFESDGRRFSHTIDPRTLRPVDHRLGSVTVVHARAMSADAIATALLVLGPEKGFELAQQSGIAAHFIIRGKAGLMERSTDAMRAYLMES